MDELDFMARDLISFLRGGGGDEGGSAERKSKRLLNKAGLGAAWAPRTRSLWCRTVAFFIWVSHLRPLNLTRS